MSVRKVFGAFYEDGCFDAWPSPALPTHKPYLLLPIGEDGSVVIGESRFVYDRDEGLVRVFIDEDDYEATYDPVAFKDELLHLARTLLRSAGGSEG